MFVAINEKQNEEHNFVMSLRINSVLPIRSKFLVPLSFDTVLRSGTTLSYFKSPLSLPITPLSPVPLGQCMGTAGPDSSGQEGIRGTPQVPDSFHWPQDTHSETTRYN